MKGSPGGNRPPLLRAHDSRLAPAVEVFFGVRVFGTNFPWRCLKNCGCHHQRQQRALEVSDTQAYSEYYGGYQPEGYAISDDRLSVLSDIGGQLICPHRQRQPFVTFRINILLDKAAELGAMHVYNPTSLT